MSAASMHSSDDFGRPALARIGRLNFLRGCLLFDGSIAIRPSSLRIDGVCLLEVLDVTQADHQRAEHFHKVHAMLTKTPDDKLIFRFPVAADIPHRYESRHLGVIWLHKVDN